MLFAILNGEKSEAEPKTKGVCPLCEEPVYSKCGEINIWHWAHYKDESCDDWYEPETEWHKNWKLIFGKENCEIIIRKNKVKHIADIQTKENVIIELQNSPIQKPIIRRRETFYGERMIWVINGRQFKEHFDIHTIPSPSHSYASQPYPSQIDIDAEYNRKYNPYSSEYRKVDKNIEEIKSPNIKAMKFPLKRNIYFSWSWSRKSWADVQRHIFIDFGDKNLFWVKGGMGTSRGQGIQISKEIFIRKYGGNIELLETVIENSKDVT